MPHVARRTASASLPFSPSRPEGGRASVRAGNWSKEEAPEEARKAFEHYLPNGLDTERHYVCAIVAEASGEKVGHLWYCVEPAKTGPRLFILDVGIDEPHRRKGYGAAALKALEREASRLGTSAIRLHIAVPENGDLQASHSH